MSGGWMTEKRIAEVLHTEQRASREALVRRLVCEAGIFFGDTKKRKNYEYYDLYL